MDMEAKIKKEEKNNIAENAGKVLMNLGQMIFGTLFLGSVLHGEIPHFLMMIVGVIGAGFFIFIGLLLAAKGQESKE